MRLLSTMELWRSICKAAVLFLIGAFAYSLVELLWRGYTHWTMALLGGICFLLIGGINNWIPWEMPIWLQCIFGAIIVTAAELFAGLILNVWLGMHIWDYTEMPFDFLGIICPQFSAAWAGISFIAIILDDFLRYRLFGEQKPKYRLWF